MSDGWSFSLRDEVWSDSDTDDPPPKLPARPSQPPPTRPPLPYPNNPSATAKVPAGLPLLPSPTVPPANQSGLSKGQLPPLPALNLPPLPPLEEEEEEIPLDIGKVDENGIKFVDTPFTVSLAAVTLLSGVLTGVTG